MNGKWPIHTNVRESGLCGRYIPLRSRSRSGEFMDRKGQEQNKARQVLAGHHGTDCTMDTGNWEH